MGEKIKVLKKLEKQSVVAGKYGFYPCSYETFQKLRKVNYVYFLAKKMMSRWNKWNNKMPKNRVIRKYIRNEKGQRIGSTIIGPAPEPERCNAFDNLNLDYKLRITDWIVEADYKNARYPKKTEAEVQPLRLTQEQIEKLYELAMKWLENRV